MRNPEAWLAVSKAGTKCSFDTLYIAEDFIRKLGGTLQPLYKMQTPLTEDQIARLTSHFVYGEPSTTYAQGVALVQLVRSIERVHGIGETTC